MLCRGREKGGQIAGDTTSRAIPREKTGTGQGVKKREKKSSHCSKKKKKKYRERGKNVLDPGLKGWTRGQKESLLKKRIGEKKNAGHIKKKNGEEKVHREETGLVQGKKSAETSAKKNWGKRWGTGKEEKKTGKSQWVADIVRQEKQNYLGGTCLVRS